MCERKSREGQWYSEKPGWGREEGGEGGGERDPGAKRVPRRRSKSVPIYIYIEPRARLQPVAAVYPLSGYICVFPFTPWDTVAAVRRTLKYTVVLTPS